MQASYDASLSRLLKDEGGYTNHPSDPGGPTNWGITLADARMYWKPSATAADVKAMPLSVAKQIYAKRYWDAQRCNDLPAGVDYAIFDYGVNSGIGRSGKVLRRCLGLSDKTSAVTQEVVDAARKVDPAKLCNMIWSERLAFLKSLKTWPTFGKGWGARVAGGKVFSQQLIAGAVPNAVVVSQPSIGKAIIPVNTKAQAGTTTATVAAGTAITASPGLPTWAVAAIVVATLAVAFGVVMFFVWRQKQQQEAPAQFTVAQ